MDLAKWVENKKIRRVVKILSYITLVIVIVADFVILDIILPSYGTGYRDSAVSMDSYPAF